VTVRTAIDHRMHGLLWAWARDRDVDRGIRTVLGMRDLRTQAHHARVERTLVHAVTQLEAAGIDVATLKGIAAEVRWYRQRGERPCADVDLWLAPHHRDRVTEAVRLLEPEHPWLSGLDELVARGRLQSLTLRGDGVEIDLHLDPFKLGVVTRQSDALWARTEMVRLPGGQQVRALDATTQLLLFLIHLNKDRFQRLLGFADVARLLPAADHDALARVLRGEGFEVPVLCTLEVVVDELRLPWPGPYRRPRGWRAWLWRRLWPRSIRLRGREGRLRYRLRQNWIGVLARGRAREALTWWLRDSFPPRVAVRTHYAHIEGPYVWKLVAGRLEARRHQRRRIDAVREDRPDEGPARAGS
jgi:hypothetical protein